MTFFISYESKYSFKITDSFGKNEANERLINLFETYHITFVGIPLMVTTTTVLPHTHQTPRSTF